VCCITDGRREVEGMWKNVQAKVYEEYLGYGKDPYRKTELLRGIT